MEIQEVTTSFAKEFLDAYHPLRSGGCLRGVVVCLCGYECGWPSFLAVFVYPRSRWKYKHVVLELTRLAWSGSAVGSAATFLRKALRILRRTYKGLVVTYALPGSEGVVYQRSGFIHDGHSSGSSWSKRGLGERATKNTIGTGKNLKRFFASLS